MLERYVSILAQAILAQASALIFLTPRPPSSAAPALSAHPGGITVPVAFSSCPPSSDGGSPVGFMKVHPVLGHQLVEQQEVPDMRSQEVLLRSSGAKWQPRQWHLSIGALLLAVVVAIGLPARYGVPCRDPGAHDEASGPGCHASGPPSPRPAGDGGRFWREEWHGPRADPDQHSVVVGCRRSAPPTSAGGSAAWPKETREAPSLQPMLWPRSSR